VVYLGVGSIGQSDVRLASATGSIIVGFNVKTSGAVVDAEVKREHVRVCCHRVIYHLLEEVSTCSTHYHSNASHTFSP
jgi:translation initiation factor IF-2